MNMSSMKTLLAVFLYFIPILALTTRSQSGRDCFDKKAIWKAAGSGSNRSLVAQPHSCVWHSGIYNLPKGWTLSDRHAHHLWVVFLNEARKKQSSSEKHVSACVFLGHKGRVEDDWKVNLELTLEKDLKFVDLPRVFSSHQRDTPLILGYIQDFLDFRSKLGNPQELKTEVRLGNRLWGHLSFIGKGGKSAGIEKGEECLWANPPDHVLDWPEN